MATQASFASTPTAAGVVFSTADTSRTAPTNAAVVITGGASGTRVDDLYINATATTTANMLRLFLYNGTTYYLLKEISVSANIPSVSNPVWSTDLTDLAILLPTSSWSLRITTNNAESYCALVTRAGNF